MSEGFFLRPLFFFCENFFPHFFWYDRREAWAASAQSGAYLSPQNFKGYHLVPVLFTLPLAGNNNTRGKMSQTHSRLASVDILPARSAGAICLHLTLGKQCIIRIWQAIGIHGLSEMRKAKIYCRTSSTADFGSIT